MKKVISLVFSAQFLYAVLRVTTPILFAAMAALITNKASVFNIALEGIMLMAAFTGVVVSAFTQSCILGLLAGVIAGVIIALILGYFGLKLKTNIILAGIALNLMASGGTVFLLFLITKDKGISTSLKSMVLPRITLPLINKIPILGTILSGHNVLTYVSLLSVVFIYYLLYKTPLGTKIRAVGENEDAADSVGISVMKIKYIALAISGVLAGLGGVYMSMGYVSWFSTNMTAGRGFISIVAAAMGGDTPLGTFLASLLFGFADALSNSLSSFNIPPEFIQALPYITTIFGLVIYSSKKISKENKIRREKYEKANNN